VRGAAEPFKTGLDYGNLFFDLTDRRTEIVAGSELEIDGQSLSMHPKVFQGAPVILPDINVSDLLNCSFHGAPNYKRCGHYLTKRVLLHPHPIVSAATTGFIRSISTASTVGNLAAPIETCRARIHRDHWPSLGSERTRAGDPAEAQGQPSTSLEATADTKSASVFAGPA